MSTEQLADQELEQPQEGAGETDRRPPSRWDSERAREAGRRGGRATAAARKRDREAAAAAELLAGTGAVGGQGAAGAAGSSAADAAIIAELERAAKGGDWQAARELREWKRLDAAQGLDAVSLRVGQLVVQLPTTLRHALLTTILELVREWESRESPAQEDNRHGQFEGNEAVPRDRGEPEADPHPPAARDSDGASAADSPER